MKAHIPVARLVSPRRRRRSGGNVIMESAFTLIPTFALIFALLDFGMMLFRWSTLQNAVREGVRYAITFRQEPALGQVASIQTVVQRNALNLVKTTDSPQHIFVKFYNPASPSVAITSSGNVPGNIVEVSVQNVSYSWMAPLSGLYSGGVFHSTSPMTLKVYAFDILGGLPVGVTSVPE
jgi:Flp pilus assembly protein TadG